MWLATFRGRMKPFAAFRRSSSDFPESWPEMSPARRRLVIAGLAVSALLFLGGFALMVYLWRISRQVPAGAVRAALAALRQRPRDRSRRRLLGGGDGGGAQGHRVSREQRREQWRGRRRNRRRERHIPAGTFRRAGDRVAVHLRRFPTPDGRGRRRHRGGGVPRRPGRAGPGGGPAGAARRARAAAARLVLRQEGGGAPAGGARRAAGRGGEDGAGGRGFGLLHPSRRLADRHRPRPLGQPARRRGAGGQHDHPAAGQERLPLQPPHAQAQGRGGDDRHDAGAAARQAADPRGLPQRDLPGPERPGQPDRPRRRRPRLLRQGRRRAVAARGGDPGGDDRVAGHPLAARAPGQVRRAAQPGAPAHGRARLDLQGAAAAGGRRAADARPPAGRGAADRPLLRRRGRGRGPRALPRRASWTAAATCSSRPCAGATSGRPRRRWRRGSSALEAGKKGRRHALQSALVSVDPRDGAVLAWVGGRDYERSQFDRVVQAHRQVGSAFKPVVYGAALADGTATPPPCSRTRRSTSASATRAGSRRTTTARSTAGSRRAWRSSRASTSRPCGWPCRWGCRG